MGVRLRFLNADIIFQDHTVFEGDTAYERLYLNACQLVEKWVSNLCLRVKNGTVQGDIRIYLRIGAFSVIILCTKTHEDIIPYIFFYDSKKDIISDEIPGEMFLKICEPGIAYKAEDNIKTQNISLQKMFDTESILRQIDSLILKAKRNNPR